MKKITFIFMAMVINSSYASVPTDCVEKAITSFEKSIGKNQQDDSSGSLYQILNVYNQIGSLSSRMTEQRVRSLSRLSSHNIQVNRVDLLSIFEGLNDLAKGQMTTNRALENQLIIFKLALRDLKACL